MAETPKVSNTSSEDDGGVTVTAPGVTVALAVEDGAHVLSIRVLVPNELAPAFLAMLTQESALQTTDSSDWRKKQSIYDRLHAVFALIGRYFL